jgi:hypothetical protein
MNVNIAKISKKREGNRKTMIHNRSHRSERKLTRKKEVNGNKSKIRERNQWIHPQI